MALQPENQQPNPQLPAEPIIALSGDILFRPAPNIFVTAFGGVSHFNLNNKALGLKGPTSIIQGREWCVVLCPAGNEMSDDGMAGLFLYYHGRDPCTASMIFTLINQAGCAPDHCPLDPTSREFDSPNRARGFYNFVEQSRLVDPRFGFCVNNAILIRTEVKIDALSNTPDISASASGPPVLARRNLFAGLTLEDLNESNTDVRLYAMKVATESYQIEDSIVAPLISSGNGSQPPSSEHASTSYNSNGSDCSSSTSVGNAMVEGMTEDRFRAGSGHEQTVVGIDTNSSSTGRAGSEVRSAARSVVGSRAGPEVGIVDQNLETFYVNSIVLMSRSDVFRAMLAYQGSCGTMQEGRSKEIRIVDFEASVVRTFILYLYTEEVVLSDLESHGRELLLMAVKYQVAELQRTCEEFFVSLLSAEGLDRIIDLFNLTDELDLPYLKYHVIQFAKDNGRKVVQLAGFDTISASVSQTIIRSLLDPS